MRIGQDDKFWVVTDPTPESEQADICFEASLRDLERQFKGGLTAGHNPTLFTDRREAEVEAVGRLVAMRVARVLRHSKTRDALGTATTVELYDKDRTLLFAAQILRDIDDATVVELLAEKKELIQ